MGTAGVGVQASGAGTTGNKVGKVLLVEYDPQGDYLDKCFIILDGNDHAGYRLVLDQHCYKIGPFRSYPADLYHFSTGHKHITTNLAGTR